MARVYCAERNSILSRQFSPRLRPDALSAGRNENACERHILVGFVVGRGKV